jgi:hypothetical protein
MPRNRPGRLDLSGPRQLPCQPLPARSLRHQRPEGSHSKQRSPHSPRSPHSFQAHHQSLLHKLLPAAPLGLSTALQLQWTIPLISCAGVSRCVERTPLAQGPLPAVPWARPARAPAPTTGHARQREGWSPECSLATGEIGLIAGPLAGGECCGHAPVVAFVRCLCSTLKPLRLGMLYPYTASSPRKLCKQGAFALEQPHQRHSRRQFAGSHAALPCPAWNATLTAASCRAACPHSLAMACGKYAMLSTFCTCTTAVHGP